MPFEPIFSPIFSSPFGAGFNPASVFLPGDVGWIYDPSNFNSMFQDAAFTIPANQPGHPVGLRLDTKHGLSLGPELISGAQWVNSGIIPFDTFAAPLNGLVATKSVSGTQQQAYCGAFPISVGTMYRVEITIAANTFGVGQLLMDLSSGSTQRSNQVVIAPGASTVVCHLTALTVRAAVNIRLVSVSASTGSVTVSGATVRELPGIHATQPVAASRPTLARRPASGVRNLLTYTEDLTNAAWTKTGATVDVSGLITSTGANVQVSQALAVKTAQDHVVTWKVKAGTSNIAVIYMLNYDGVFRAWFNLASGSVGSRLGFTDSTITGPDADGFYTCTATGFSSITDLIGSVAIGMSDADGTIIATVGRTLSAKCAQLELGAVATPYQRVGSIYDVTEAGQPDRWCLVTDGVDDGMVTPTITPAAGADKVQVVAGVRKLSDAAQGQIIELSASAAANAGAFDLIAAATPATYSWRSRGTLASIVASPASFPAPITNVITGLGDIAADSTILRVNGAQVAASAADQGTGQFGTYPAYLYRRAGTSLPAKVEDYGMICRISTTNLTAAQIGQLEAWANQRTGAY